MLAIANSIESYLKERKQAVDTLEGLVKWWLMRQKIEEEEAMVKRAVDYLLEQGKLKKRVLLDGTEIYSSVDKS